MVSGPGIIILAEIDSMEVGITLEKKLAQKFCLSAKLELLEVEKVENFRNFADIQWFSLVHLLRKTIENH